MCVCVCVWDGTEGTGRAAAGPCVLAPTAADVSVWGAATLRRGGGKASESGFGTHPRLLGACTSQPKVRGPAQLEMTT